jgi:LacI family transcriptional regulator
MLIPAAADPDPFFGQVVRGAEDVFRRKGYLLILGHTYNQVDEQSRYLSAFRSRLVDGVLLFQAPGEDAELSRLLSAMKPVVFVGRIPEGIAADIVATDILRGTQMGVGYLLKKGHTRIGLVTVAASLSVAALRMEGWRRELLRHGGAAKKEYAVAGELSSAAGELAALRLLDLREPPTAIFADNLVVATGILRALQRRGRRVPADLELVSSDDAEWLDVFRPPITAIVQPSYQLGAQAAELLLKRIRHPKRRYQKILLAPELKIRS